MADTAIGQTVSADKTAKIRSPIESDFQVYTNQDTADCLLRGTEYSS